MKNKTFSKQHKKLFLMNVSAFAIIFISLAFIMVQLIQSSSYSQVDDNLITMADNPNLLDFEINQMNQDFPLKPGNREPIMPNKPNNNPFSTQIILWSKEHQMMNTSLIGNRLSELENLKLDTSNLESITTLSLTSSDNLEQLSFRSLTLPASTNQHDVAYIQIISNVNQIQASVKQSQMIIIISMILFWFLSIAISYYLATNNMKPVLKAWDKQQEFVANASHELRTPLTIISLNLEKLFTKPNHTILQESETIAEALDETKRLSKLTSDLLLLAKSDSHSITIEKQEVEINEFIRQIVKPFEVMATEDHKEFTMNHGEDMIVSLDKEKIHQVLVILMDNALKYTQSGNIIILTSQKVKKNWVLTIENNGSKIEQDHLERIFDRFYQDPGSSHEKTSGFGLGLAIGKQIIEEHGGQISVKNIEPTGVSFQFSIPIHKKA